MSTSWKASFPIRYSGTCPVKHTSGYLLLIPSHTVPFSNQELTFILAFDRLVNIPISDSSAPPLPRTHAHTHTHTHTHPQDQNQTKQKKIAFLRFTRKFMTYLRSLHCSVDIERLFPHVHFVYKKECCHSDSTPFISHLSKKQSSGKPA